MATLPDSRSLGGRPQQQISRGIVSAGPTPVDDSVGRTLQGLGKVAEGVGRELDAWDEKQDGIAAEDSYNQLIQAQDELAYNPDTGLLNKKAGDAVGEEFRKAEMDRFRMAADQIEAGLSSGRQKEMFKQRRAIAESSHNSMILKHQSRETNVFAEATESAAIATEVRNIGKAPLDNAQFDMSMSRITSTIDNKADRIGLPPEATAEAKAAATEDAWTNRIISLVDDNPTAAKKYFDENKDKLTEESRDKISKLIEDGVTTQKAQQQSDVILLSGKSNKEMMDEARKVADPKLRDDVVSRVKARIDDSNALDKRAQADAANTGYTLVANGEKIPTTLLSQMDGKTQIAMRKLELNGFTDKDDLEVYRAIKQLPPEEFANLNVLEYAPHLTFETMQDFIDEQTKVNADDFSVISDRARINTAIKELGLGKTEEGGLYRQIDSWTKSLGHKPTGDELQDFLDTLQTEVITDSDWWETSRKIGKIKVDGVPDADIPDIVRALSERGHDASDENIKAMYDAGS